VAGTSGRRWIFISIFGDRILIKYLIKCLFLFPYKKFNLFWGFLFPLFKILLLITLALHLLIAKCFKEKTFEFFRTTAPTSGPFDCRIELIFGKTCQAQLRLSLASFTEKNHTSLA